eukprot:246198_1
MLSMIMSGIVSSLFWLICISLHYVLKLDGIILWGKPCLVLFYGENHVLIQQNESGMFKRKFLCFWMIIGSILCIEYSTFVLYHYITFYRILRLLLVIWLQCSDYDNSELVFNYIHLSPISYEDIVNFVRSVHYENIIKCVNSFIASIEVNCPAFQSQHKFAENVINCTQVTQVNDTIDLCDKFIHINVDYNNTTQVYSAINLAASRAFSSRFVPPITNVIKGKAYGEMLILSPTGLSKKYNFNGDSVYRGTAKFRKSNHGTDIFSCDVYYYQRCFNPIRCAHGVDSSKVTFVTGDDRISYKINNDEVYNCLYDDMANKLQHQYLNKMTEKNKMSKIYYSDTLPGPGIYSISKTAPKKSCRAYFTGLVVGGVYVESHVSVAYKIDKYSEYVGQGEYPRNKEAFPKAVGTTFDGIAIDANTRVIIYEKEHFQGKVLLDARGPKIINNGMWKNNPTYSHCNTDIFPDSELQENFPLNVRVWTDDNMQNWSNGSVKILSNGLN